MFLIVNSYCTVSLADVAQTQMQGKTDVLLELHVDDTTEANEVCSGQ